MGRQNDEAIAVGSSIALLQERFRQLEKMREKRELLKLFPNSRSRSRSSFQDSLSLGLSNSYANENTDFLLRPNSWSLFWSITNDVAMMNSSRVYEKSDVVDTSLHL